MSESNAGNISVYCKECGQLMEIIEQEELEDGYYLLVTCWQPTCLLRGFTLSLDHYESLKQLQLEAYRETNRLGQPQFARLNCY